MHTKIETENVRVELDKHFTCPPTLLNNVYLYNIINSCYCGRNRQLTPTRMDYFYIMIPNLYLTKSIFLIIYNVYLYLLNPILDVLFCFVFRHWD